MLLNLIHLILYIGLCFILILRHVFDLGLEGHVFRFDDPIILSLFKTDLIRKSPPQYLNSTLVKDDIELILFHFEGVLMIEDGIE